MTKVYWKLAALAGLVAIVWGIYWWQTGRGPSADSLYPNLVTEILGIIITLIFVDRIVRQQKEEDRQDKAAGAYRKTGPPIRNLAHWFARLVRGSLVSMPDPPPESLADLFQAEVTDSVEHLDLATEEPAPPGGRYWGLMTVRLLSRVQGRIRDEIGTYGDVLPTDYYQRLDELLDQVFIMDLVRQGKQCGNQAETPVQLTANKPARDQFFGKLVELIQLHNQLAETPIQLPADFFDKGFNPGVGALRTDGS